MLPPLQGRAPVATASSGQGHAVSCDTSEGYGMGNNGQRAGQLGFMADPGAVADWRFVVLTDAVVQAGVLDALPATVPDLAGRLDLDPHALAIVLGALREWEVVDLDEDRGVYARGTAAVTGETADVLHQHAGVIARWSSSVPDRLRGELPERAQPRRPEEREKWMRALAANAREAATLVADRALERFPDAQRVLDVAGGHGEYGLAFARRGLDVTLQDLPEMVDVVRRWPSLQDSGVRLFAGDVFEELPGGPFDLVVISGFTHTQPAHLIPGLLARLRAVTAPGGGIAIRTLMRDRRPTGPIFAVQMLLGPRGGDTHGWLEYQEWLTTAGYEPPELTGDDDRALILAAT